MPWARISWFVVILISSGRSEMVFIKLDKMPWSRICWYVVSLTSSWRSRMVSITLDTMPWARIGWYVISLYRCSRRDRLVSSTLDTRLGGRIIRRVVSITLDPMQWAKINRHTKKRMHEEERIRECRLPMRTNTVSIVCIWHVYLVSEILKLVN